MCRIRWRACAFVVACLALALATAPAALADKDEPKEPKVASGAKPGKKSDVKFEQTKPDAKKEAAEQRVKVKADKAVVKEAKKNPAKAADAYFKKLDDEAAKMKANKEELPPNLKALEDKTKRKTQTATFEKSLALVDKLNEGSGDDLAFGITDTMHMTDDEWRKAYTTPSLAVGTESYLPAGANSSTAANSSAADAVSAASDGGGGRRLLSLGARSGRALLQSRTCYREVGWTSSGQSGNTLPTYIDWRTASPFSTVTPVRNQGSCGSCVAFASMAGVEAGFITRWNYLGYTAANTDLSEVEQMRCLTGDQCAGATISQLPMYMDRATCRGVAFESAARYVAADNNVCPSSAVVPRYISGISKWTAVPKDRDNVRRALKHNLVGITIRAGFDNFRYYTSGVWPCGTSTTTDHMVAITGYRDAVPMANGQTWKVFNVKNSWGSGWGEAGYFKLRADCAAPGALAMYTHNPLLAIKG